MPMMNNDTIPSQLNPVTIPSPLSPMGEATSRKPESPGVSPLVKWMLAAALLLAVYWLVF